MRFFVILALALGQNVCLAQAIDPSTLTPVESEETLILSGLFSHSTRLNQMTATYKIPAGIYRSELSGEIGTFYRGGKDCLSTTTSTPSTGLLGGGSIGASKYDCGILLLTSGGALIYFYQNDRQFRSLRTSGCSGRSCSQMRSVRKLAQQQIGKIFFVANMEPSMQLASNLAPR